MMPGKVKKWFTERNRLPKVDYDSGFRSDVGTMHPAHRRMVPELFEVEYNKDNQWFVKIGGGEWLMYKDLDENTSWEAILAEARKMKK